MCIHEPLHPNPGACGLGKLYFAWDSVKVTTGQKAQIAAAAECLSRCLPLFVEGHSDALGGYEYNLSLSEIRAAAVFDAMVEAGVPGDQMQVIVTGDLSARATQPDERARDRSVITMSRALSCESLM